MITEVEYLVQSPWTDNSKNKTYPLTRVKIEVLPGVTITKTGLPGIAIQATIKGWNGLTHTGVAVYAPEPKYPFSFLKGAKIALERAMADIPRITKKMRTSIWHGLFLALMIEGETNS